LPQDLPVLLRRPIKINPAAEENIPALPPPRNVGKGFDSVEQYGVVV